jgi:hypothetical protein
MSIISAQKYMALMQADQRRIFAILVNEVGMKKAKKIPRRVVSDEPIPAEAMLLDAFDTGHDGHITVNISGASGDEKIRELVRNGIHEAMGRFRGSPETRG